MFHFNKNLCRAGTCPRRGSCDTVCSIVNPYKCRFAVGGNMSPPYIGAYSADSVSSALSVRCMAITRLLSSMRMMITPCVSLP